MASFKRVIEKTWLATFIVVALVFVISYFRGEADKLARILDADLRVLGWAVIAQVAYFFATVLTWQKTLLYVNGRTVTLRESLSQILVVNFGKYIPGKVWGMAARGKRLAEAGYDMAQITRASYVEQILLLLTGCALALLAAAVAFDNPLYWLGFALAILAIALFRHGDKLVGKLANIMPRAARLLRFLEVRISTLSILKLSLGFVFEWLFLSAAFIFVCTSFVSVELDTASAAVFVLSLTAGFLAGFLALFAPGGVGVREGVGAIFLSSLVTLEEAVLLMLLFRVWVVATELLAGAVAFIIPAQRGVSTGGEFDG